MSLKQKVGLEWVSGWYPLTLLQILLVLKHRFEISIRNEKFPESIFIEKREQWKFRAGSGYYKIERSPARWEDVQRSDQPGRQYYP